MSTSINTADIFDNLNKINRINLGDGKLLKSEEKTLRGILVEENIKFLKDINSQLPDIDLTPLIKSKELQNFILNIAIYIVYDLPLKKSSKIEEMKEPMYAKGIEKKKRNKSKKKKRNKSKKKNPKKPKKSKRGGAMRRRHIPNTELALPYETQQAIEQAVNQALARQETQNQEGFLVRLVRNNPLAFFLTKIVYFSSKKLGRVFTYMLVLSFICITLYSLYTTSMAMNQDRLTIISKYESIKEISDGMAAVTRMDLREVPIESTLGVILSVVGNIVAGSAAGRLETETGVMRAQFNLESAELQQLIYKQHSNSIMFYYYLVFLVLFVYMLAFIPKNQEQRRALEAPREYPIEYTPNVDVNAEEVN